MSDKIGDAKLAQRVIDAYAHDPEGLTREECKGLGLSTEQANLLSECLGYGEKGEITSEERERLAAAGFNYYSFTREIDGWDGKGALQERAKWLGKHVLRRPRQRDYSNKTREGFVRELGDMGRVAKDAVPELIIQMGRGNCEAAKALVKIGIAAVPQLVEALKDRDKDVRTAAAEVLDNIRDAINEDVPSLLAALKDEKEDIEDIDVCRSAIDAFGWIGPVTPEVVPALIAVLKDNAVHSSAVHSSAIRALGKMGPAAKPAVPALIELWNNKEDLFLSELATKALIEIGPAAEDAAPVFIKALKDDDEYVRRVAAIMLVRIGYVSDPALLAANEASNKEIQAELEASTKGSFEYRALSARLEAMQEISYRFFMGVDFEFMADEGGGYYDGGYYMVVIRKDSIGLGTFAHELAHHWGSTLAPERSELFDRISWQDIPKYRYLSSSAYDPFSLHLTQNVMYFPENDFARDYGMSHPHEDLATVVGAYVGSGESLRSTVRKQMDRGNFELAAKYLFVKHVMPFAGREYNNLEGDSLTIEEVKQKYQAAKDRSKTNPGTYDIILEIEKEYPLKTEPGK
ncbi:MAG: HEAT repeat domain-containing protein [bacterium]